ncbi:DedA family protein [Psychromarinibacter sp. C21-152]|uniref:DedA family protein n=1 Tax=Psychromarinibacter sediminicola TaxID=3033385 RepID=A0AAE3NVK8_9RHOB|nr:DedA family protein [Psychromarinibacter sediminicola]MDF0602937.1 DedA family protein [Psychromarinibacter sediminicola]
MIDTILAAVPVYGLWIVTVTTFLSCLALPVPASLVMLTAGAFVAAGDLPALWTGLLAWIGAVAGDQAGFALGRGGGRLLVRLSQGGKAASLMARARELSDRYGGPSVFLSRWLLSPLGPYMNFVTGAAGMAWPRFAVWGLAGEAVWVAIYIGLGFAFAGQIAAVATLAADFSGTLAAGAVTLGLGLWLRAALKADRGLRK